MKKYFSILLTFILILTLALPASATSAESIDAAPTRDAMVEMGCELFPEYADKITSAPAEVAATINTVEAPTVVTTETRAISDNENLTYVESTNGIVNLVYTKTWTETGYSSSGTKSTYKGNLCVICNRSTERFYADGITYVIDAAGTNYFTSSGSAVLNSTCTVTFVNPETVIAAQKISLLEYRMYFTPLSSNEYGVYDATVYVTIANQKLSVSVNGTTIS